jgi:hypothetical protein
VCLRTVEVHCFAGLRCDKNVYPHEDGQQEGHRQSDRLLREEQWVEDYRTRGLLCFLRGDVVNNEKTEVTPESREHEYLMRKFAESL